MSPTSPNINPFSPPDPTPPVSPPPASNNALNLATSTALIAAPILLLIPPRKLDLYTLGLCTLWAASAEHQVRARSGKGILQWAAQRSGRETAAPGSGTQGIDRTPRESVFDITQQRRMPNWSERADPWAARGATVGYDGRRRLHSSYEERWGSRSAQGRANRTRLEHAAGVSAANVSSEVSSVAEGGKGGVSNGESAGLEDGGVQGVARKLWMGNETSDWKEKRAVEEQQAIDEGQSVADRILAQIWAVWNQAHLEGDDARRRRETLKRESAEEKAAGDER